MSQLPRSCFSTLPLDQDPEVSAEEVESNWIDTMSAFCQVEAITDTQIRRRLKLHSADTAGLRGSFDSYLLPGMMLMHTQASAQQFRRTESAAARDGLDAIGLICWNRGSMLNIKDPDKGNASGHDIHLVDFSRNSLLSTSDFETFGLVIPRHLIEQMGLTLDNEHLSVLSGRLTTSRMLRRHIQSLYLEAPAMSVHEASTMTAPTLALLKACLTNRPEAIEQAAPVIQRNLLLEIRQLIDEQLFNPALNADLIAQQLNLSRAGLYRLAEPLGGIQRFIQSRRLKRAFQLLILPFEAPSNLARLAYELGFQSEDTFRRQFKATFGMTPSEARAQKQEIYQQYHHKLGAQPRDGMVMGEQLHQQWIKDIFS